MICCNCDQRNADLVYFLSSFFSMHKQIHIHSQDTHRTVYDYLLFLSKNY